MKRKSVTNRQTELLLSFKYVNSNSIDLLETLYPIKRRYPSYYLIINIKSRKRETLSYVNINFAS